MTHRRVSPILVIAIATIATPLAEAKREKICNMQAQTVQSDARHFTLVVTYPKHCEVSMDTAPKKITLSIALSGGAYVLPKAKPPSSKKSRAPQSKPSPSGTPLSGKLAALIDEARSKIGSRYVYGASGPAHFDCSGFVYYLYRHQGIEIPRTSRAQSQSGAQLVRKNLKKGDMVFFDTGNRGHVNHSGIYLGNGKFIHSSSGKAYGVTISNLDQGFYKDKLRWGVRVFETKDDTATKPHIKPSSKKGTRQRSRKPAKSPQKKQTKKTHRRK